MRRILGIALISLTALAQGQIYKWVDANGKTQFSDQPPPGSKSQPVKISPSSGPGQQGAPAKTETLAEKEAAMKQRRLDRADAEAKEEEKAKRAAETAQRCSELKGQLHALKQATRLVRYDENGKRQTLGAEDRKAEKEKLEQDIQKNCQE